MPIVQITGPISQPLVLDRGYSVSITPLAGSYRVQIPGEGVSDSSSAASSYGPYSARREVVISIDSGAVEYDVDESGGGQSSVSGDQRFMSRVPQYIYQAFSNLAPQSNASAVSLCNTLMVPVQYHAVQIGVIHCGQMGALTSGTMTGRKILIAATDDVGTLGYTTTTLTDKAFITPHTGGAEVNDFTENGWRAVTFGGAATCPDIADPGVERIAVQLSDVIELHGKPVAYNDATGKFAGYYPLIIRDYPGTGFYARCPNAGMGNPALYLADSGPNIMLTAARSGDCVTTPSTWTQAMTPVYSDNYALGLFVILYGADEKHTVMMVGDSRFGAPSASESTTAYRNTMWRLEQQSIAAGKPVSVWDCAHGGRTTDQYFQRARQLLLNGTARPTTSIYLVYSINDGTPTTATVNAAKYRALMHKQRCAELGIRPIWLDIFPFGTGYGSAMPVVTELRAWTKSLGDTTMDLIATYGDTATGAWVGGLNEDQNHMTPAGQADFAGRLLALVNRAY